MTAIWARHLNCGALVERSSPDRCVRRRLVGALTLELNGHFVGGFEPADALYAALVDHEADALGL